MITIPALTPGAARARAVLAREGGLSLIALASRGRTLSHEPPPERRVNRSQAPGRSSALREVMDYAAPIAIAGTSGTAPGTRTPPSPNTPMRGADCLGAMMTLRQRYTPPDLTDPHLANVYRLGLAAGKHWGHSPWRAAHESQVGVVLGVPRHLRDALRKEEPRTLAATNMRPAYIVIFDPDLPGGQLLATASHELGHCLMHAGRENTSVAECEAEANAWTWGFCKSDWEPALL